MYQRFALVLVLGLCFVGATIAQADVLMTMNFSPDQNVNVTGVFDGWGVDAPTVQAAIGGSVAVDLGGVSFNPITGVGTASSIQFVGSHDTPGTVTLSNTTAVFTSPPGLSQYGDPSVDQLIGGTMNTAAIIYSNPIPVSAGSFSLVGNGVTQYLNGGQVGGPAVLPGIGPNPYPSSSGYPGGYDAVFAVDTNGVNGGPYIDGSDAFNASGDLGDEVLSLTNPQPSTILDGASGTLTFGKNPDNSIWAVLNLNMNADQQLVGALGLHALINGEAQAVYGSQAEVPEPGTLVMVLGLVASLAVYGWKRR